MSEKTREDEWFQKFEQEMIRDAKRRRDQDSAAQRSEEAEKRKALHWMKCPKCGGDMETMSLEGIGIDKCSSCEGLFFDRGELDEILLKKSEERRGIFRRLSGLIS